MSPNAFGAIVTGVVSIWLGTTFILIGIAIELIKRAP